MRARYGIGVDVRGLFCRDIKNTGRIVETNRQGARTDEEMKGDSERTTVGGSCT